METEKMKIELNQEEAQLLDELNVLQEKIGKYDPKEMNRKMFDELQKTAIDSLAVALNISDVLENSSTISSNIRDFKKRQNLSTGELKGKTFGDTKKRMCEKAGKDRSGAREHFIDYVTGEELIGKDPEKGNYDFDHVISAEEMKYDILAGIFMSDDEFRKFLNSDKNVAPLNRDINQKLKKVKTWKEFEKCLDEPCKQDATKTNAEYYGIDKKRAFDRYKESRKAYYKVIGGNAVKAIGGYAIKMTVFKFVKIVVIEIISECKLKSEETITIRMKQVGKRIISRMSELVDTFKESALANIVSTLMDIIINFFLNTTKRAFKIIRQIFSSILNVFKVLFDSSKPSEERIKAALNILGVALTGILGILLEETINKALLTIPFLIPFADYISPVLAALITGIGGVLILQLFSKHQADIEYYELGQKFSIIQKKLNGLKIIDSGISNMEVAESIQTSITIFGNTCYIASACEKEIANTLSNIHAGNLERKAILNETNNNLNDIDNLLSQMNNKNFNHE